MKGLTPAQERDAERSREIERRKSREAIKETEQLDRPIRRPKE